MNSSKKNLVFAYSDVNSALWRLGDFPPGHEHETIYNYLVLARDALVDALGGQQEALRLQLELESILGRTLAEPTY